MTLRLKVIISVLVALVVSAGLIYGISHIILLHEMEEIEADQIKRDVAVARGAIDRELDELDARAFDYGTWDDSYDFVLHPDQEFIDSNLPDNIYSSFKVNLIAYVRPDGSLAYGGLFDLESGARSAIPSALDTLWSPEFPLLSAAMAGNAFSGLVRTEAGTLLVASRPITLSNETGEPRGAVVMARLLNGPLIAAVSSQTQLNISAHLLDASGSAPGELRPLPTLADASTVAVVPVDGHLIEGFARIDDIYGHPAVLLKVQAQRVTYEHGKQAVTRYLWIVLAIVCGLGVALNLALTGWVLAPLGKLVGQVKALAAKRGRVAGARIEASKGMEFAALGQEINHLLAELETTQTEIAQLYGVAREQADRDPVTGLLSRRAVFEGLERRLANARERSGKLALLMIDIDGFKLFNDTYGHLAGDSVLRLVSKEITARTREGDLAGRFGGDEILMVLTNTDTEGAIAQAGRLLDAANAITWVAPDGTDVPVSLSVGVAAFPGHATEINELLAFADANLYDVKEHGRRSVSAGATPAVTGPGGYGFGMLDSLISALQEKDQYTRRHSEEVASIGVRMAEALGLDDRTLRAIRIAGLLHDVGKTGIPASLLMRPGHLTEQERDLMRRHVDIGLALIRDVPELDEVLAAVGSHHEHIDGSGYPHGLRGERIPLTGRILAVADTYSAMMSFRPYRHAKTQEEAELELRAMAGVTLDERLVEVFLSVCRPRPETEVVPVERDERGPAPAKRLAQEGV